MIHLKHSLSSAETLTITEVFLSKDLVIFGEIILKSETLSETPCAWRRLTDGGFPRKMLD